MDCIRVVLIILLCLSMTSCATIMHGKNQNIFVNSDPIGAVVRVENIATTTPGSFILDRTRPCYQLVFEKEGYKPVTIELKRGLDGWLFGNILLGGIVGLAVDFMTGAAYKLSPTKVDVDFAEMTAHRLPDGTDLVVFADMEYLKERGVKIEDLERL